MRDKWPEACQQLFPWWQVFVQPHPRARPVFQVSAVGGWVGGRRRCGGAGYSGSLRLRNHSRHGTDHDSKPLPPPSGIRLLSRPLRLRQEKRRSERPAAGRIGGGLLGVPQAGAGLRSSSRTALRIHPRLGVFGLFPVQHAARPVPPLWRGGSGRGSLERWQAPVDQGLHAVPGPLGAQALLAGNRRGVPHFLGKGVLRRRVCGRLGPGASHAGTDPRHRCGGNPIRQRSQIPDAGLPNRPGHHPPAVGRQGTHHRILPGIFHPHWKGTRCADRVRVLGYGALPQMRLLTYQMPDELLTVASAGEFDEFDLNEFFAATGTGKGAKFKHKSDAQKWLDIIRGQYEPKIVDGLKTGSPPPFPYSDARLLPYLQQSFWFLPNVAACQAMANLLAEKHNIFWREYDVVVAAGASAGMGLEALPPVRKAIGSGFTTKTITLSCGKLTTGVTVPQWSSILMLRNLKSPETYFQAAFRVQSPWSIKNPNGDNTNEEEILKPVCFVFDFAPTRALRQLSDYGIGLSPNESNPESAVKDLVSFLPVLAYDGANMTQIDAGGILDIAMAGTSATLLARKWESPLLVNVDNDTLRRVLDNPEAMAAVERIEGWRALGDNIIETIINKSEKVKELKNKAKGKELTEKQKKQLTEEEKEYKSKRKLVQEKLIKFATRIPAFMYLTDFRENTLQDVITKLEPDLFVAVTGLTVKDFHLLVRLKVFNTEQMNQAVFAFRRYEDASLRYTGIESHEGLAHYGLYDTVIGVE